MIPLYIPTYGRAATIRCHLVFPEATILVHDGAEADRYRANPTIDRRRIVVTGVAPGPGGKIRQMAAAICGHRDGEWVLIADDDIGGLEAPPARWHTRETLDVEDRAVQRLFREALATSGFFRLLEADIARASADGVGGIGFASTDNAFFRGRHWAPVGYMIGCLLAWRAGPFDWRDDISMEDFRNTAELCIRDGAVLLDRWIRPVHAPYQPGGLGTFAERVPQRRADVQKLLRLYPDFFRVKDRPGVPPGTDLAVAMTAPRLPAWVAGMRARRVAGGEQCAST